MAYKVAIDASGGGKDNGNTGNGIIEKDYTLLISKYISDRLSKLGIDNFLVRDGDKSLSNEERVNIIKNKYGSGNNVIVISNRLNKGGRKGAEIMYALRNNSRLASNISKNLESAGQDVTKYYQLRDSKDTNKDKDPLIRDTPNNQTLVINYGYVDSLEDANKIKNNYEELAEAVVKAITTYAGVTYHPINEEDYYVVKKGDNLWNIASKYNTTVDELKKINNISNNELEIGQFLKIPKEKEENTKNNKQITYIVKKGDSLWVIANKYDTTVDKIKEFNKLTSNNLNIGQKLIIPSSSSYRTYIVKKDDNLYKLANEFNTTVNEIKKINNLNNNDLSIGQELLITE